MKLDSVDVLAVSRPHPRTAAHAALLVVVLSVAATVWLLAWYGETFGSMAAIWWRSETFAHGLLIFPISAWLIWTKREELSTIPPAPSWWGIVALAGFGFIWLLARLAEVLVVQQFALIGMVGALVLALLGPAITRTLAFPLAFLALAVPFGEALIPPMMDYTANFTVAALRATGIPVYREGTFFSIPSGNWSVVEGCSGLRYLIASFAGGCLYAYLTYRSLSRRLLFIAAAVVVPIIANWMRAYMIVMIAHLSDMRLALGVDHLIYGWVFFGLVMLALLWVGSFWRETGNAEGQVVGSGPTAWHSISSQKVLAATVMAVIVAGVWPLYAAHIENMAGRDELLQVPVPQAQGGWQIDSVPLTDWRPRFKGTDASLFEVYRKGDARVAVYLGLYRHQRQGSELINSQNLMVVQKHPVWSNIGESNPSRRLGGSEVPVRETRLRSAQQRLLIWDWVYIDGRHLSNPYLGKILLAWDKLSGSRDDGVAIILATPSEEHTAAAEAVLEDFVGDMLPEIETSLRTVAGD